MTLEKILEHANGDPWTVEGVTLDVILFLYSDFLKNFTRIINNGGAAK